MPELLLELGLEEVPARMIAIAQAELGRLVNLMLTRERLIDVSGSNMWTANGGSAFNGTQISWTFSTPRRLTVLFKGVADKQQDLGDMVVGPSVAIAYKDGVPTPAALAFAKKNGIAVDQLVTTVLPRGEYISARITRVGLTASEILAKRLPEIISNLYWAKNMRWIPGSNERFVRPVLWMVCLLGEAVVPVEFAGKTAGRASFGHRVLSSGEAFEIVSPASYVAQLEGEYVVVDVEARRQKIRKALDHVTRQVEGARWREDHALVDAVTHLTEWPDVLLGGFERDYLELPEEVLVTVMRDHQKYFAVEDAAGKLAPYFLTVTNIALDEENAAIIRQGNERVLRARFNDARFFWEFDQRTPLVERVKLLESVTFQKDLGSYAAKRVRVSGIAQRLALLANERGAAVNEGELAQAVELAKTDLTTELVKEFTELQGIIGGLYARSQGLSATVADAIYDQYMPASAGDGIPRSVEGAVLGLADRMDTIAGMFSLGMEPTGSKDPFALRRAANAVVRILAESPLPLRLTDVLTASEADAEVVAKLRGFFAERIEFYLREVRGQAYDVAKAAMAARSNDLRDLVARAEAVSAVRGSEDFLAVSAAFKRMKNILAQAKEKGLLDEAAPAPEQITVHSAQSALAAAAAQVGDAFAERTAEREYVAALELIATLRPQIDHFFDQVMVMDEDPYVRGSRLRLLESLVHTFSRIADFSEMVVAG